MSESIKELQIADLSCTLYLPPDYDCQTIHYPAVYINGEAPVKEILAELKKLSVPADFLLLSVKPKDWNDDFTPWKAPAFREGEKIPGGNADAFIAKLTEVIKPYMDMHYRTKPCAEDTILLGYSLGGLAALYSLCRTDQFAKIGSLSGSLWYDGFVEFMEGMQYIKTDRRIYLSLGKKEAKCRNARMGRAAECTKKIQEILENKMGKENVTFEWTDGGHFHEIPKRFAKALLWFLQF